MLVGGPFIGPNIGPIYNNNIIINNYYGCCPQPQIPPHIIIQLIMVLLQLLQIQQGGVWLPTTYI